MRDEPGELGPSRVGKRSIGHPAGGHCQECREPLDSGARTGATGLGPVTAVCDNEDDNDEDGNGGDYCDDAGCGL